MLEDESEECSTKTREVFWEYIVAFESAKPTCLFDALTEAGLSLPPQEELNDSQLTEKLYDTIRALAFFRVFLECTDHLNDR